MPQTIPLTHFEELMLHQDSSAYPASCFLRLRFRGLLDHDAFEAAARLTILRHPLLHATVVENHRRYYWRIGALEPQITWIDGEWFPNLALQRLDIRINQGVRFIVRRHADDSELLIQFHHACCDGIAIYQLARDLLIAYTSQLPDGPDLKLPSVDHNLLRKRESPGLKTGPLLKLIIQQAAQLPKVMQFFIRTASPLVPHEPSAVEDAAPWVYPAIRAHHFDIATSAALRESLTSGTTVNDLLTRDLFLAMRSFRKGNRIGDDTSWLRLMVPVSLRRIQQYRASAANIVGAVFLTRRGLGMRDPDDLLSSLQREMSQIKRLKLGHLFNFMLVARRLLPGGLRRFTRPGGCQFSAVFTNIGKVLTGCPLPREDGRWICGNVILESTEAAAPIARNVCSSFSATWYANRLSITLHHDPRAMSERAAAEMLSLFVHQVRISAGVHETTEQDLPLHRAAS